MHDDRLFCAHCGRRIGAHDRVYAQGASGVFYDGEWLMVSPRQRPPRLWHAACRESLPHELHPRLPAEEEAEPVAAETQSNVVPLVARSRIVRRLQESNSVQRTG